MQTSSSTSLAQPFVTERFRSDARPEDLDAVAALTRATGAFREDEIECARELLEEALERGEDASGYYFLFADGADAEGKRRLDGYACFGPIPMTMGRYELYWIAVHPEAKRSGLGKQLAQATEDAIRAEAGTHIFAVTSTKPDYWGARAFYEAQGYRQYADVPDYHADGDGLAMYGKKL